MHRHRVGLALAGLVVLEGCGGVASVSGSSNAEGSAGMEGTAGARAIDTTGQPAALVMSCPLATGPVALSLPCHVGRPITGGAVGLGVTECDLSGSQDSGPRLPPIGVMLDLPALAGQLNAPVRIPMSNAAPPGGDGTLAGYPGEHFSGSLEGTGSFSQVDAAGRAFVGRLLEAQFHWKGDQGHSFSCTVTDAPFWAVAGDFR